MHRVVSIAGLQNRSRAFTASGGGTDRPRLGGRLVGQLRTRSGSVATHGRPHHAGRTHGRGQHVADGIGGPGIISDPAVWMVPAYCADPRTPTLRLRLPSWATEPSDPG